MWPLRPGLLRDDWFGGRSFSFTVLKLTWPVMLDFFAETAEAWSI
jgi:hypothetical protein